MKKPYYSFQRRNPIFSACWRKKHRKSCCSLPITLYISLEVQSWWEWWHFIGKEYGKIMITFLFRSLLKVCGNWSPFVVFYSLQSWLYLYVFVLSGGTCNNRATVHLKDIRFSSFYGLSYGVIKKHDKTNKQTQML